MINQELFDRQVEHMLAARRYHDATKLLVEEVIKEHRSIVRKLLGMKHPLEEEYRRYLNALYDTAGTMVGDYVGAELDFQVNNLRKAAPFYWVEAPDRGELRSTVLKTPIRFGKNKRNLAESLGDITAAEYTRVSQKIRKGIANNVPEEEILKEVLDTTRLTDQQAKTLVTTSFTHAEALIRDQVIDKNKSLIAGVIYTAILDSRTSSICSSTNGLFQPLDRIKVRPPLHWNCRSSLVPVIKEKAVLESSGDPRITGPIPEVGYPVREDFASWLTRQTMEVKMRHLGSEEKVALLEKGALSMSDFFSGGRPLSLSALRVRDNILTFFNPITQQPRTARLELVKRPSALTRSREVQDQLRELYLADSINPNTPLSLVDYRGTSIAGKRSVRARTNNEFDERNFSFDPFTGEVRSTLYYDPNFTLYRERMDYMEASKSLSRADKEFIKTFVESMEDRLSVNQQTAVVENLRVLFERFNNNPAEWESLEKVVRAEMNYSVINTSRLLDRRSREAAELFLSYTGGEEPSVMISGVRVPIEELHRDKLKYTKFLKDWKDTESKTLARKLYYTRQAPWRAWFFKVAGKPKTLTDKLIESFRKRTIKKLFYKDDPVGFYLAYGQTPKKWTDLIKKEIKDKIEGSIPYYKFLEKLEKEGVWNFLSRTVREQYRSIVDYQVAAELRKELRLANRALDSVLDDKQAINVLSSILETVADGTMTDYDSLAITIGQKLREKWKPILGDYLGSSLEDYHEEGSRILTYLKDQGILRVNSRGVVRRAVVDLDTGMPSGAWKDTVSREVSIIDPDMRKYQDYARRLELTNRMGIDRPANKYYAVPGSKTYRSAQGEDTGIPLITRSAYSNFDEKIIDKDFVAMLNHTMAVEFQVDEEFFDFFDNLVKFKDSRGRAAYYDALNVFREEIIRRGDAGFGLLEGLRYYKTKKKTWSNLARIDGRGRLYYNGKLPL